MVKVFKLKLVYILFSALLFSAKGNAQSPIYFSDVGSYAGCQVHLNIHGSGFFDFNDDGWADIFIINNYSDPLLYEADHALFKNLENGTFQYWTNQANIGGNNTSAQGMTVADYDNDGDVDIVIAMGVTIRTQLYRNNGDETFSNFSAGSKIQHSERGRCVTFFDYNNDGHVDFLSGSKPTVDLMKNKGDDTFAFVTYAAGLGFTTYGQDDWGFALGDVDNDNDMDIYFPRTASNSRFYLNDGDGTFSLSTAEAGLPSDKLNQGAIFLDYNNDGWLDLFIRGSKIYLDNIPCRLFRNNQDGTFTNVTSSSGINYVARSDPFGGGLNTGDFNNDGFLDILIVERSAGANKLFRNNGNGTFTNVASSTGLTAYREYWTMPVADYDHDGYLDIYCSRNDFQNNPPNMASLYQNAGGTNHWLQVKLVGGMENGVVEAGKSNRSAIGARVYAYTEDRLYMRQVLGGTGYAVNSLEVEFGLGEYEEVDSLVVYWPSGDTLRIYSIPVDTIFTRGEYNGSQYFRPFIISGEVGYYTQNARVQDVKLVMGGDVSDSSDTDSFGLYNLVSVPGGVQVSVIPEKAKGEDVGNEVITAWDAYLAASYAVGSDTLNTYQISAADVDNNQKVELYDAALIARHVVELTQGEINYSNEWRFVPPERTYSIIIEDYIEQDFTALVLGDVSGNWSSGNQQPKSKDFTESMEWIATVTGEEVKIPVVINESVEVCAADIWLSFDPQKLKVKSIAASESFDHFELVYNEPSEGLLKIVLYGTKTAALPGQLISVRMEAIDNFENTEIQCERCFINESPFTVSTIVVGTDADLDLSDGPAAYRMDKNYPNPFNPATEIKYALRKPGHVSLIIYDIQGRQIRKLKESFQDKGDHAVVWDGRDDYKKDVPSGVYFCRLISDQFSHTIRMVKTK